MKMSHNKKRNVGIIYELLVRAVSAYLIENDKPRAQIALNVLTTHYNKNTELYKEFRLFNALAKTTVKDSSIAAAILTESRAASRRFDAAKLDNEKSSLIREINYSLADDKFYRRSIPDYRVYASIQTLLNEWRQGDRSNLSEVVVIESTLIEWLTSEKKEIEVEPDIDRNVDSLVVKIMNEKFNKKYNDKLTNEQKDLINDYVFSVQNDDCESIKFKATMLKNEATQALDILKKTETNHVVLEKAEVVANKLAQLTFESIDDDKLSRLMTITQLIRELKGA
jgi:hypothetical protein